MAVGIVGLAGTLVKLIPFDPFVIFPTGRFLARRLERQAPIKHPPLAWHWLTTPSQEQGKDQQQDSAFRIDTQNGDKGDDLCPVHGSAIPDLGRPHHRKASCLFPCQPEIGR